MHLKEIDPDGWALLTEQAKKHYTAMSEALSQAKLSLQFTGAKDTIRRIDHVLKPKERVHSAPLKSSADEEHRKFAQETDGYM